MAGSDAGFEGGNQRPRRSRNSDGGGSGEPISAVDPASLGTGNGDGDGGPGNDDGIVRDDAGNPVLRRNGEPKRKPGRKPGGNGGTTRRKTSARPYDLKASVDTLSQILAVLHEGIAVVAKTPEMSLDESEAKLLATAAVPVLEQFNITPDPRFAAAFGLIAACGTVYVPRAVLIRARLADEAQRRADSRMRNVTPTPTAQPTPAEFTGIDPSFFGTPQ